MSRTLTDNTYRFATTEEDDYLERVTAEAAKDTNFIIVTEKNTVHGPGTSAYLLFRGRVLSLAMINPDLTLAGKTIGELLESKAQSVLNGTSAPSKVEDFFTIVVSGEPSDVKEELVYIRGEIREITKTIETVKTLGRQMENIIAGRTVRVNVESY